MPRRVDAENNDLDVSGWSPWNWLAVGVVLLVVAAAGIAGGATAFGILAGLVGLGMTVIGIIGLGVEAGRRASRD